MSLIKPDPDHGKAVKMNELIPLESDEFRTRAEQLVATLSATSRRVYRDTFARWWAWTAAQGLDPLAINYPTVQDYLLTRDVSKASKQREKSALTALAQLLAVLDFDNPVRKAAYESLKFLKVRTGSQDHERGKRALSPADADRLLRVWKGDATVRGRRNRALIAVLLLAGLRREELAALTWSDVDLDQGVLTVRHGKGDQAREAALYGTEALEALQAWRSAQPAGYRRVFVSLRKGGHFTGDTPMSTTAVWQVVDETAELAGCGHIKPHDLRRTLATELLETGAPVHHVQQLGHTNASTTLNNYTGQTDARQRRRSGKVRYG